jgi:hypothetical protein
MTIGQTRRIQRAIMGVLRPLMGTRSTGTIVAKAAPGQVSIVLPKTSFVVPLPASATGRTQLAWEMPFITTADTTVLEAGSDVAVASLLGGARQNLAKDTVVRFDPPLAGMVQTATVKAAMTGGADASDTPGMVRDVVAYESFDSQGAAQDVFLARAGDRVPALVLAWIGSGAVATKGNGLEADTWKLYCVVAHGGGSHQRSAQALDILDAARDYLLDRSASDGIVFSAPPTTILGRDLFRVTPSSTIYSMTFETTMGVEKTEHRGAFNDWDWTRLDLDTATTTPKPVVDEAIYAMT